jgi:hypothetical protein
LVRRQRLNLAARGRSVARPGRDSVSVAAWTTGSQNPDSARAPRRLSRRPPGGLAATSGRTAGAGVGRPVLPNLWTGATADRARPATGSPISRRALRAAGPTARAARHRLPTESPDRPCRLAASGRAHGSQSTTDGTPSTRNVRRTYLRHLVEHVLRGLLCSVMPDGGSSLTRVTDGRRTPIRRQGPSASRTGSAPAAAVSFWQAGSRVTRTA